MVRGKNKQTRFRVSKLPLFREKEEEKKQRRERRRRREGELLVEDIYVTNAKKTRGRPWKVTQPLNDRRSILQKLVNENIFGHIARFFKQIFFYWQYLVIKPLIIILYTYKYYIIIS